MGGEDDDPTVGLAEEEAALEAEPLDERLEDDAPTGWTASATASSRAPTSTSAWRSARRWRSSRSLRAEKIDVAIANSQNEVTLRTGIRSNSMPTPGVTSTGRDEPGRLGVEDDEQEQRVPEGDLQAGPIRGQERDGHQLEVDDEPDRALGPAGRIHRAGQVQPVDAAAARSGSQ